ncbi:Glycosyltransferase involved in cell wall bisynthesis [Lachnospiraceae bacterium]|nr:Glycosyltransferase involved in cell wall bisynthesis [Lachnospiraceae bacterium]
MRIVVLDIAASKTGALTVLQDFAAYVQKNACEHEWFFVTGAEGLLTESPDAPDFHVIVRSDVKKSKMHRLAFDSVSGAEFLSDLKPDVVLSLQNTLPKGTEKLKKDDGSKVRTVLYVHQPLGFQKTKKFSFLKAGERELAMYQYLIANNIDSSIKKADHVIVQTDWMKKAVMEKDGIPEERISAVLPNVEDLSGFFDESVSWKPGNFIFPAGPIYYKNHRVILEASKILRNEGLDGFKTCFTLEPTDLPWVRDDDWSIDTIEWLGSLPKAELMRRYQTSTLIFPSYIETFGYPPAEARQFGVPVLAADTPFTREVLFGYDNARFFDPFSPEELAQLMRKIIRQEISPVKPEFAAATESSWKKIVALAAEGEISR